MVTPAMSYFLHKGLCEYGYVDESFRLFRSRFDKMLEPGLNGTLWEEWWLDAIGRSGTLQKGRTRSDAQTESAFPPALFAEFLLGVQPTKPGMQEVLIAYHQTKLNHLKGVIPSPLGQLAIEWNFKKKSRMLILEIPDKMIVKIDLKSLGIDHGQKIVLNKEKLQLNLTTNQFLSLETGKQVLEF